MTNAHEMTVFSNLWSLLSAPRRMAIMQKETVYFWEKIGATGGS